MSSLKLVLISAGVLSAAILLSSSAAGAIVDFAERVPSINNRVVSSLFVINFIIIAIVALSKLHFRKDEDDVSVSTRNIVQPHSLSPTAESIQTGYPTVEYSYNGDGRVDRKIEESPVIVASGGGDGGATWNKENEYAKAIAKLERDFFSDNLTPAFSTRFSNRRNVKAKPEGVRTVVGVSRSKKHDTLESTWRTISQGHVKTPDTTCDRPCKSMKKAKTFNDRTRLSQGGSDRGGPEKLRRDASLGREELNMRVEAFIKKFKEDLRMQEQEEMRKYRK